MGDGEGARRKEEGNCESFTPTVGGRTMKRRRTKGEREREKGGSRGFALTLFKLCPDFNLFYSENTEPKHRTYFRRP
jgi:hypothetical protein